MAKSSSFTRVSVITSMSVEEHNGLIAALLYISKHRRESGLTDTAYSNTMEVLRALQEAQHGENTSR